MLGLDGVLRGRDFRPAATSARAATDTSGRILLPAAASPVCRAASAAPASARNRFGSFFSAASYSASASPARFDCSSMSPSSSRAGASGPGVTAFFSVRSSRSAASPSGPTRRSPALQPSTPTPMRRGAESRPVRPSSARAFDKRGCERFNVSAAARAAADHRYARRRDRGRTTSSHRPAGTSSARSSSFARLGPRAARARSAPGWPRARRRPPAGGAADADVLGSKRAPIVGQRVDQPRGARDPRDLQVGVGLVVHRVQLFGGRAARAWPRPPTRCSCRSSPASSRRA